MIDRDVDYPTAVTSYDDAGVDAANRMVPRPHGWQGQAQRVDRHQVQPARQRRPEQLVHRHSDVDHVTGRGGAYIRGRGPVLMAWADMKDICAGEY